MSIERDREKKRINIIIWEKLEHFTSSLRPMEAISKERVRKGFRSCRRITSERMTDKREKGIYGRERVIGFVIDMKSGL